jgi:hypothetical protein
MATKDQLLPFVVQDDPADEMLGTPFVKKSKFKSEKNYWFSMPHKKTLFLHFFISDRKEHLLENVLMKKNICILISAIHILI